MKSKIRRYTQILFFIIFVVLLVQTEYKGTDELGQPVRAFLEIDPLLSVSVILAVEGIIFYVLGVGFALGLVWLIAYLVQKFAGKAAWAEKISSARTFYSLLLLLVALFFAFVNVGFPANVPMPMAFGVLTLAVTITMGRVFCGWLCPMGAVMQFTSWLKKRSKKAQRVVNKFKPHQNFKYYALIILLVTALFGFNIIGMFDPISSVIRSFAIAVNPVVNLGVNGLYDVAYLTDNELIIGGADKLYDLVAYPNILSFQQPHFMGGLLVSAFFLALLFLNLRRPRYWCRVLCPLGALLGFFAQVMPYKLRIDKEKCNSCGNCHSNCQGACDPEFKEGWRPQECFVCFHCTDSCPSGALKFSFKEPTKEQKEVGQQLPLDLKKRRAFQAAGMALVGVPLIKATEQYKEDVGGAYVGPAKTNPWLIRPPGAMEEKAFLDRCVRCGECMKVCPTNALHPATLEAGPEGIWTPVLVPQLGYCEYYCTLCGQVCPTGAIEELTVETKLKTVIGTAFFDISRCLPYAFGVDCIVCEEHCPTSPKAIWFEEVDRPERPADEGAAGYEDYNDYAAEQETATDGEEATADENVVMQDLTPESEATDDSYADPYADPYADNAAGGKLMKPMIDLKLCIGCGICEKVCVVADQPAVRITAVGEGRSNSNSILFEQSYEDEY
jgi:ferredoxin